MNLISTSEMDKNMQLTPKIKGKREKDKSKNLFWSKYLTWILFIVQGWKKKAKTSLEKFIHKTEY